MFLHQQLVVGLDSKVVIKKTFPVFREQKMMTEKAFPCFGKHLKVCPKGWQSFLESLYLSIIFIMILQIYYDPLQIRITTPNVAINYVIHLQETGDNTEQNGGR